MKPVSTRADYPNLGMQKQEVRFRIDFMNNKHMNYFPLRLKELRSQQGLSQVQLARLVDVTQEAVSRYERGKDAPGIATLTKLAETLQTTTDYLLGLTDRKSSESKLQDLLSPQEQEAMRIFRELSHEGKDRSIGYMLGTRDKKDY